MSYIVLARKYRPQTFQEVVGQSHIIDILTHAITSQRLAHAYLFCGPRGIGKTSCARILAKALNCQKGMTVHPCGQCPSCVEIANGTSFDVVEIDGASNRGIDEIRALRENVKFAPSYGRYKIYIVDEVHMLTTEAFNALLKTLEEPPEYVKFIFATTEPHKVLSTIISRCQKFDFKRASIKTITEKLEQIVHQENLKVDPQAMYAIAKAATGSLRDALSILDQLSALSVKTVQENDVVGMLGLVETELIFSLADAIAVKNCAQCFEVLDEIVHQGKDIKQLLRNMIEHYRHLMIVKVGGQPLSRLVDYPVAVKERLLSQSQQYSLEDILKAIDIFVGVQEVAKVMDSFQVPMEVALAKLTIPAAANTLAVEKKVVPVKTAQASRIANQKGHLDFSLGPGSQASAVNPHARNDFENEEEDAMPSSEVSVAGVLTLECVQKTWDAVTFAISRERMSVATYLQEGSPCALKNGLLVIGFPEHARFHKEALEDKATIALISKALKEQLKSSFRVELKIVDDVKDREHGPVVTKALEKFQGKVVHKWHQEHKA